VAVKFDKGKIYLREEVFNWQARVVLFLLYGLFGFCFCFVFYSCICFFALLFFSVCFMDKKWTRLNELHKP